jgi:ELWxxDGT repeat protein
VKDIVPGAGSSNPTSVTALGGAVYFMGFTPAAGFEIWKSDGTDAGTYMVKDINPGPTGGGAGVITALNGKVYFRANDGVHGTEPWVTDGTAAGTFMLGDLNPGLAESSPIGFIADDDTVYFQASNATVGLELWQTDGTVQGTSLVYDIRPGVENSMLFSVGQSVDAGKSLVFAATDGISGLELWKTDKHGTFELMDIAPGPGSSSPATFAVTEKLLFFSADDNSHGRELYVMPANVAQLPPAAIQNPRDKFNELLKYPSGPGMGDAMQFLLDNNLLDLLENQ